MDPDTTQKTIDKFSHVNTFKGALEISNERPNRGRRGSRVSLDDSTTDFETKTNTPENVSDSRPKRERRSRQLFDESLFDTSTKIKRNKRSMTLAKNDLVRKSPSICSSENSATHIPRLPPDLGSSAIDVSCVVSNCPIIENSRKPDGSRFCLFNVPDSKSVRLLWALYVPDVDRSFLDENRKIPNKICERHFVDGRPTPQYPFPSKNLANFDTTTSTTIFSTDDDQSIQEKVSPPHLKKSDMSLQKRLGKYNQTTKPRPKTLSGNQHLSDFELRSRRSNNKSEKPARFDLILPPQLDLQGIPPPNTAQMEIEAPKLIDNSKRKRKHSGEKSKEPDRKRIRREKSDLVASNPTSLNQNHSLASNKTNATATAETIIGARITSFTFGDTPMNILPPVICNKTPLRFRNAFPRNMKITTAPNHQVGFSLSKTIVAPSIRPVANKSRCIQPKLATETRLQSEQEPIKLLAPPTLQPELEPPSQPEVKQPPVKSCSHCGDELKRLRQDLEQLQRNLTAVNSLVTETLIPLLTLKIQETDEKLRKNDSETSYQSEKPGLKSTETKISYSETNKAQKTTILHENSGKTDQTTVASSSEEKNEILLSRDKSDANDKDLATDNVLNTTESDQDAPDDMLNFDYDLEIVETTIDESSQAFLASEISQSHTETIEPIEQYVSQDDEQTYFQNHVDKVCSKNDNLDLNNDQCENIVAEMLDNLCVDVVDAWKLDQLKEDKADDEMTESVSDGCSMIANISSLTTDKNDQGNRHCQNSSITFRGNEAACADADSKTKVNSAVVRAILLFSGLGITVTHLREYGPTWLTRVPLLEIKNALNHLVTQNIIRHLGKYPSDLIIISRNSNNDAKQNSSVPIDVYRKVPVTKKLLQEITNLYGITESDYLRGFDQIGCKATTSLNKLCRDVL